MDSDELSDLAKIANSCSQSPVRKYLCRKNTINKKIRENIFKPPTSLPDNFSASSMADISPLNKEPTLPAASNASSSDADAASLVSVATDLATHMTANTLANTADNFSSARTTSIPAPAAEPAPSNSNSTPSDSNTPGSAAPPQKAIQKNKKSTKMRPSDSMTPSIASFSYPNTNHSVGIYARRSGRNGTRMKLRTGMRLNRNGQKIPRTLPQHAKVICRVHLDPAALNLRIEDLDHSVFSNGHLW